MLSLRYGGYIRPNFGPYVERIGVFPADFQLGLITRPANVVESSILLNSSLN